VQGKRPIQKDGVFPSQRRNVNKLTLPVSVPWLEGSEAFSNKLKSTVSGKQASGVNTSSPYNRLVTTAGEPSNFRAFGRIKSIADPNRSRLNTS
jgi:hypothetical protein